MKFFLFNTRKLGFFIVDRLFVLRSILVRTFFFCYLLYSVRIITFTNFCWHQGSLITQITLQKRISIVQELVEQNIFLLQI